MTSSISGSFDKYIVPDGQIPFINMQSNQTFKIYKRSFGKFMMDYSRYIETGQILDIGQNLGDFKNIPVILNFRFKFNSYEGFDGMEHNFYTETFLLFLVYQFQLILEKNYNISEQKHETRAIICLALPFLENDITYQDIRIQFPWAVVDQKFFLKKLIPEYKKAIDKSKEYLIEEIYGKISDALILNRYIGLYGSDNSWKEVRYLPFLDSDIYNYQRSGKEYSYLDIKNLDPFSHSIFTKNNISTDEYRRTSYGPKFYLPFILSLDYYTNPLTGKNGTEELHVKKKIEAVDSDYPEDILLNLGTLINPAKYQDEYFWKEMGRIAYKTFKAQPEKLYNNTEIKNKGFIWWWDQTYNSQNGKSKKDCIEFWNQIKENDLYASVKRVAEYIKIDSYEIYKQWKTDWVNKAIGKLKFNITDEKMARIFYRINWLKFLFVNSDETKRWFIFNKNIIRRSNIQEVNQKISKKLSKYLNNYMSSIIDILKNTDVDSDSENVLKYEQEKSNIQKSIMNIQQVVFKNKIVKESENFFICQDFYTYKDKNPYLLGTSNSIVEAREYDIHTRNGFIEDYITKSTLIPIQEGLSEESEEVKKVQEIINQIFLYDKEIVDYFWLFLASLLRGKNAEKRLNFFIGNGDNGKSIILKMINAVFGDYSVTLPQAILTANEKTSSGSATPELAQAEGSRIATITELNNDQKLGSGAPKRLSGEDALYSRGLYKEGRSITQTWKIIIATNIMPRFQNPDKALFDRVMIFPFDANFSDYYPESLEKRIEKGIFPKDLDLENKIPNLAPALLYLMCKKYPDYRKYGLKKNIPLKIKQNINSYWDESDIYRNFIITALEQYFVEEENYLKPDTRYQVRVNEVMDAFITWFNINEFKNIDTKPNIRGYLSDPKRLGPWDRKINGWYGIRISEEFITKSED